MFSLAPNSQPQHATLHRTKHLHRIPTLLAKTLSHTPFRLQSLLLSKVLADAFNRTLPEDELNFLQNKVLEIHITDISASWYFTYDTKAHIEIVKHATPDVCIRGKLDGFILLAAQKEDPDTLFFQRELIIEGDTDLGLQIKNVLDSIEIDKLPPELLFLLRSGAEYVSIFNE
ncbi:MAG: SCP2 sterol-binding domain-containing protein [Agarilytica sp.]